MKLHFREIEPADIEPFSILMEQLSEPANDLTVLRQQIIKAQQNPDMYLMAAVAADGTLVGTLIGLLCADFCGDCRPILFVENVVTLDTYRGKGIGKAMFTAIEAWGNSHACSYVVLVSALHRLDAHGFYHAIGYEEAKGFKKYL